ncbi:macro domain-containing protein [Virgibacillus salexigens]|uniref:Macro domain-containing protein n=1 Tax=Virgibacillus massiliensis TaxID=1462526 RepID=A0A024QH87_9BACI|nr:hypothetical protein [Virgibacillus massiliensis]CDQ41864.1 hypothetical protein BN990_04243 [Virgibacillus massiliensis]
MLHVVQGDLLESDCTVIAHQCNCFNTMGAGIAKQIKNKYPLAYVMDQQAPYSPMDRLGEVTFAFYDSPPLLIFNLYGQYSYGKGRHTDYNALSNSISKMMRTIQSMPEHVRQEFPFVKVGVPYGLGSGLAGGYWNKVKLILDYYSEEFKIDIFAYKL